MSNLYLKKLPVLNSVFMPSAPVEDQEIFFGRIKQITQCMDAVTQKGRHIVLYGERGVGKTSFANIIRLMLQNRQYPLKLTCNTQDTVESIWKKVFDRVIVNNTEKVKSLGLIDKELTQERQFAVSEIFGKSGFQTKFLDQALQIAPFELILIFDEFDRLGESFDKAQFVDHIKNISDNYTNITLFFVGVAETISELIGEHPSLKRNLMQIRLP